MSRSKQPRKPQRPAHEKAAPLKALTPKQTRFCQEYLIDLNGTQAAIRAGYSKRTPNAIACELLGKPEIQAEIDKLLVKRSERTGVTADRVIQELKSVAFANLAEYMTWDGNSMSIKKFSDLTVEQKAAIGELYETVNVAGVNRRIKLIDKLKALELLGKHLKLFTDQVEVSGREGQPLSVQIYLPDNGR